MKRTALKRTPMRHRADPVERAADALFSAQIIARDGYCRICGSTYNLTCAHVIRRGHHAVRWVAANAVALCWMPCHAYFNEHEDEWRAWCLAQGIAWDNLHWRALHDTPERAEDALERLRGAA